MKVFYSKHIAIILPHQKIKITKIIITKFKKLKSELQSLKMEIKLEVLSAENRL